MRVSFTFGVDDLRDVVARSSRRRLTRSWFGAANQIGWFRLFFSTGAAGWLALVRPETVLLAASASGVAGLALLTYLTSARRVLLHDYLEYTSGGPGPYRCEVELDARGVVSRQFGEEIARPRALVSGVRDLPDGVEIDFGRRGVLVVRPNAFSTAEDRAAFGRRVEEGARGAAVTQG